MNAKMITVNNYKILGQAITYIRTDNLPDLLPRKYRSVSLNFNTPHALDLYSKLNHAIAKLDKGETTNFSLVKATHTLDDWMSDGAGKPVIYSEYLEEIFKKYRRLEDLLDTIGSSDPVELEYYLNALSPILLDLLKIVKVLLDIR